MKYIDPKTKEVKTIYTKASDTLPIGSIVDFDGEEIPDGWEPAFEDATVYIGPNEPTDGQDIWIQKSKNLFDKNNALRGYELVSNEAGMQANAEWFISPYISVVPGRSYYLSGKTSGTNNIFYDNTKTKIGAVAAKEGIITIPEGVSYLRFNGRLTEIDTVQLELGETPTTYEPYIDKKIYIKNETGSYDLFVKNRVHIGPYQPEDGEEVWIQKSKNLYNKNGYMGATYPNMYPTGKTELQSSGYIRSTSNYYSGYSPGQLIRVEKNTNYTLSLEIVDREVEGTTIVAMGYKSSAGTYGAFYTKSFKNNLGMHVFNFNTGDNTEIIVSLNGVFNTESKQQWIDYDNVQLEKGTPSTITYEPYIEKKIYTKNDNGAYEEFYKTTMSENIQVREGFISSDGGVKSYDISRLRHAKPDYAAYSFELTAIHSDSHYCWKKYIYRMRDNTDYLVEVAKLQKGNINLSASISGDELKITNSGTYGSALQVIIFD